MNYRTVLTERPGEFEETLVDLYVEIDGQTYRSVLAYIDKSDRKQTIAECFYKIAGMISPEATP